MTIKINRFTAGVLLLMNVYNTNAQIKIIPEQEITPSSGVFVSASMDFSNSELTMTMKGPDNKWFGVGFGFSMADADVLIYTDGKLGSMHPLGVTDYNLNAQNANGVNKDAVQNWSIISESATGGVRTIVASRALNTGDAEDHVLNFNDASVNFIWAKGSSADFTLSYHGAGNRGTGTIPWQVVDNTAPLLESLPFSPADDQTNVSLSTNLVATFNEAIAPGNGVIELRLSGSNTIVESFDVSSVATFSGNQITLNPNTNLMSFTDYYVVIPANAIQDVAGNSFVGFTDNTTWNFKTLDNSSDSIPPVLISLTPANGATDVVVNATLSMQFDEDIQAGTGVIELRLMSSGTLVEAFDVNSVAVQFNGGTIQFVPAQAMNNLTEYYVVVENGAIEDLAGNIFGGISDTNSWRFTTIDDQSEIPEMEQNFNVSLSIDGSIQIQNLNETNYTVKIISLNGKELYSNTFSEIMVVIDDLKLAHQIIVIQISTDTASMNKMIRL